MAIQYLLLPASSGMRVKLSVLFVGSCVVVFGFGISFGVSTGAAGAIIAGPVLHPPVAQLLQVATSQLFFFLQRRPLRRSHKLGFFAQGSHAGAQVGAHAGAGAQTGAGAHTGAGAQTGAGAGAQTGAGAAQAGAQVGAAQQSVLFLAKSPFRRSHSFTRGPQAGAVSQAVGQVGAGAGQQASPPLPPPKLDTNAELINRIAVFTGTNLLRELRDASHGAAAPPMANARTGGASGVQYRSPTTSREPDPK